MEASYNDEIVLALLTALLKKQDINEVYYWLQELKDYDLKPVLWQIYYDFYYELNADFVVPKQMLVKQMLVKQMLVKQMLVKQMLTILFQLPATPLVFILCQAKSSSPNIIYKKTMINNKEDVRMYSFRCALKKQHYHNISYYGNKLLNSYKAEEIAKVICDYFKVPVISKCDDMRDDMQYIMAVYGRASAANANTKVHAPIYDDLTMISGEYTIPNEIDSFRLKRWQRKETDDVLDRLSNDPQFIALALKGASPLSPPFGASLGGNPQSPPFGGNPQSPPLVETPINSSTGLYKGELAPKGGLGGLAPKGGLWGFPPRLSLKRGGSGGIPPIYIWSQLSASERKTFILPTEAALQNFAAEAVILAAQSNEPIPQFGIVWLLFVFPQLGLKERELISYKMLNGYL